MIIIKVGFPRTLNYYKYKDLICVFFNELKIELITPEINDEILELSKEYIDEDCCDHIKYQIGSIKYLEDKCDYILLPDVKKVNHKESICPIIKESYNIAKLNFPNIEFLHLDINIKKNKDELSSLIKIGQKLNIKYEQIIKAYKKACYNLELLHNYNKIQIDEKKLNNNNIIVAGNFYSITNKIRDSLVNKYYNIIFSDYIDYRYDSINSEMIDNVKYTYIKEYIKSIEDNIDISEAIILIPEKNCFINNLVIETIKNKINNKPIYILKEKNYQEQIKKIIDTLRGSYETNN